MAMTVVRRDNFRVARFAPGHRICTTMQPRVFVQRSAAGLRILFGLRHTQLRKSRDAAKSPSRCHTGTRLADRSVLPKREGENQTRAGTPDVATASTTVELACKRGHAERLRNAAGRAALIALSFHRMTERAGVAANAEVPRDYSRRFTQRCRGRQMNRV